MARYPVDKPYTITTKFGVVDPNSKFGKHTGLDLAKVIGSPKYAPEDGVVSNVTTEKYNGKVVQIKGKSGKYHRSLHCGTIFVKIGQAVKESQKIATVGMTGLTSGPHEHWDVCSAKTPTSFSQFTNPDTWLAAANKPAYPKWVKVIGLKGAFVRSKPSTSAPLSGSRYLPYLTPFRVAAKVKGESIGGNPYWYKTMYGNYVWTGNVK